MMGLLSCITGLIQDQRLILLFTETGFRGVKGEVQERN